LIFDFAFDEGAIVDVVEGQEYGKSQSLRGYHAVDVWLCRLVWQRF
jgi:hypothetical protein